MTYCTPSDVWNRLNKKIKVREETVSTTIDGSTLIYDLTNSALIDSTFILRTGSAYLTSVAVPTNSYSINITDGVLDVSASVITAASGSTLWTDYDYAILEHYVVVDLISSSDRDIEHKTGRNWYENTTSEYLTVENSGDYTFFSENYPHISISSLAENYNSPNEASNWVTRSIINPTGTAGGDYINNDKDKTVGRVRFFDNEPKQGED